LANSSRTASAPAASSSAVSGGPLLGEIGRPIGGRLDRVRTPGHKGFVLDRLGLDLLDLLGEGEQDARVLAAHPEHVRGLSALEDLDIDIGALLPKIEQAALDGLLGGTTGEFFSTQWHYFLRLRRFRSRPDSRVR